MYYTLIDKIVVPCDMFEWSRSNGGYPTHVGDDTIEDTRESIRISTVFVGLSMVNWSRVPNKHPLVFETMIFGGDLDQYQWRYSTWGEAEEGHKRAVDMVKASLETNKLINNCYGKNNRSPKGRSVQDRNKNMYMLSRLSRLNVWHYEKGNEPHR